MFLLPFALIGCTTSEGSGERPRIFEIDNTAEVFGKQAEGGVTVRKHYMILDPPEDLTELKELAEKYNKDHPVEGEVGAAEGGNRFFHLYFYRESDELPRDWQPDEGYLNTDRLEHHRNDVIASITWSDADPQKKYHSYHKDEKGKIIKQVRFVEDRLVE
ncbi:hypothetical protein [Micromonospora sagamiensis]|uniref:Uncharacterized protein n=1 Tax=Micromonospora sagamiensis TaxID=47875 RepID=A0A562WLP7_9ACTN|nr:hypothetical protein [Micromonospora sagamiensis]TWJ31118.1 hypothetical protein JD81_04670 [Micromonospora sagamiensis]